MHSWKSAGLFGLLLMIGLVASTYIVSDTIRDVRMSHQIIKVRGYAEVPVTSDLARWEVTACARDAELPRAYAILAGHQVKVRAFLEQRGLKDVEITVQPVSISETKKRDTEGNETNEIEFYTLTQGLQIVAPDVRGIATASESIVGLLGEGVEFHTAPPRYYYTGVNDLKSKLLVEATKDARSRAQVLAEGSGVGLGPLRAARQGVFSVCAAKSSSISENSYEDVSAIDKKVTAIVTVDYAMR